MLLNGGYILGVMIVIAGVLIGYAMYARKQSLDLLFGLTWPRWFNTLIEDLHLIGHSRYLYFSFFLSGAFILAQILPIYALVLANGLAVPWTASLMMMVLLRLSSIVPQAPGNIGSFQWVTARTLIMFGLAAGHAKRFSLILWAVITIPLIVVGFIALAIEGINMTHLRREATRRRQQRTAEKRRYNSLQRVSGMLALLYLAASLSGGGQTDSKLQVSRHSTGRIMQQAEQIFSGLASADPKNYAALFNLALAETGLKKDDQAAGHYKLVLTLKPGLYEAELNLGMLYLRDHQAAEAVPLLREAAKQKPEQARPKRYLGDSLFGDWRFWGAAEAYREALAIDPKLAAAELGPRPESRAAR